MEGNNDKKNNSNMWIWGIVIVVILIALFFILRSSQTTAPAGAGTTATTTTTTTTTAATLPPSVQDTSGTTGAGVGSIAYSDALVKYAGRIIELDDSCQVPRQDSVVTYKDNSGIMIDNRSASPRTVTVGTQSFTMQPYTFKIIVLPDVATGTIKSIFVGCDDSQNVATIIVQE